MHELLQLGRRRPRREPRAGSGTAGVERLVPSTRPDQERCQYAKDFPSPCVIPPSVVPVLSSRTPGEQDILRSEMTAISEIYLQVKVTE